MRALILLVAAALLAGCGHGAHHDDGYRPHQSQTPPPPPPPSPGLP